MKTQCKEEVPEEYGLDNSYTCLLPKGHSGEHISFQEYDGGTSWEIDPAEESFKSNVISKEETLLKLQEAWGENIPKEIADLFSDADEDEE